MDNFFIWMARDFIQQKVSSKGFFERIIGGM